MFGVEIFLRYSQFFVRGDFVIGGVECIMLGPDSDKDMYHSKTIILHYLRG